MRDRFILTAHFLDQPERGLESLVEPRWVVSPTSFPLPDGTTEERLVALYRPLVDLVAETAGHGDRPVSVAGDCVTSLAMLAGLQRAGITPTLIWFDSHGDFNTPETTPSGFLGGMPLAMAVGRGDQTIVEGLGLDPIPEEKVILADARDLDPGEREAVEGSAVTHLPRVEALLEMEPPAGPLYVHYDCDVLDPTAVPAVHYPAAGGPSVGTLDRVFRHLAKTSRVIAVSLSSWAPELDEDGRSAKIVMGTMDALLG